MNTKKMWLASLLLLPVGAALAYAQEKKVLEAGAPKDDVVQQRMTEFYTPGPAHKVLDTRVGKWNVTMKMYEPGKPPSDMTYTSESKWVLDGHFLEDVVEGTFQGQPFHGRGLTGYDNMKKKYVSSWVDNHGTGISYAEGTYDGATKAFNYTSESPNFYTNQYGKSRWVDKMIDADHFTSQMYQAGPDGKEYMSMEFHSMRMK